MGEWLFAVPEYDVLRAVSDKKPIDLIKQRQGAPVPLRVAASLVYFQLRRDLAAQNERQLDRALNDAALALAQLGDVYYENDLGHVLRIPHRDLDRGLFEGGAKTFRSASGSIYSLLSMRRIDVMYAMDALGKSDRALGSAGKSSAKPTPLAED